VIPRDRAVGPAQDRGRILSSRTRSARAVALMARRLAEEAGLSIPGRGPKRSRGARVSGDDRGGPRPAPVSLEVGS
jgi:hypothetical protein